MKDFYKYKIFGLVVSSEIECPEINIVSGAPDVVIRFGYVPLTFDFPSYKGACFESTPGKLLLKVMNVARYLVSNGNEIIIDPEPNADEPSIRLFLLGSAMGALLLQRGILPLHGSSISANNEAIVIAGMTGMGKSTLAARLLLERFEPLADDIAAINFKDNIPYVIPGIRHLKLWRDSLLKLNIQTDGLKKVRNELEKFYYLPKLKFRNNAYPLKMIYILNYHNDGEIEIRALSGVEKFRVLRNNIYRRSFVEGMDMEKTHFELIGKLASKTKISKLFRGKKDLKLTRWPKR